MPDIDEVMVIRLACSKLCHDLISPVSAVNNGLELVADAPAGDPEAMDLITSSARAAADRLQFYRVAFGFSGGSGQSLDALRSLLKPLVADAKCESEWQVEPEVAQSVLSLDAAQIVLNAIAVGLDCLPRSGQASVALRAEAPGRLSLMVDVYGPSVRIRDEVSSALSVPLTQIELSVRVVNAIILRMVAARTRSAVRFSVLDSRITLTVESIPIDSGS